MLRLYVILHFFFHYVGWCNYALQQPSEHNITFGETLHIGTVGTLTFCWSSGVVGTVT